MTYESIRVGYSASFTKKVTRDEVMAFAKLTGDYSPRHVDTAFGKKSSFGTNLVHGMLAGSLFSTLVGMHCPGEESLYLSQTLQFKTPIFYDDTLLVRGTVTALSDAIRMVTLRTEILKDGVVAVDGEARVRVSHE